MGSIALAELTLGLHGPSRVVELFKTELLGSGLLGAEAL